MNTKLKVILFSLLCISLINISVISAQDINEDITISETNDYNNLETVSIATNFTDLQKDIDENDEIKLSNNVTMLNEEQGNFTNGILINKTIAIDGNGYTIDANGLGRIFQITNESSLTLKNTILINGNASDYGGAICKLGGNLSVVNCSFSGNNATYGGGAIDIYGGIDCNVVNCSFSGNNATYGGDIANFDVNTSVLNCKFSNNTASVSGGAIYNEGDSFSVVNCIFSGNNASSGGAIVNFGSNCNVMNSNFSDNTATYGGAITNVGVNCNVVNSSFSDNTATNDGGAIYNNYDGNFSVLNCNFSDNTAASDGGAIYNEGGSSSVANSSFNDNNANSGGAIVNYGVNCSIMNCSFSDNTATYGGGAIRNFGSKCNVVNSSFNDNNVRYGGAIYNEGNNFSVVSCNFSGNNVKYGGAIYNEGNNFSVVSCNFSDNIAQFGGDIYSYNNFYMINCFINSNSTVSPVYIDNGNVYLSNNTINLNQANIAAITINTGSINSSTIAIVMNNKTENVTLLNSYKIKVVFTDDNGNIIRIYNNASVIVNESKYDLIDNGTYSYYDYTPKEVGTYNIGASADSLTNLTVKNGTLEVLPTSILLTLQNLTKYYNDTSKQLIASLTFEGKGLANKTITFFVNGYEYNRTTDENGTAKMNINLIPGIYTVNASYTNNSEIYTSYATITILTTINATDLVKVYHNDSQFYATFLNSNGSALADTNVTFNIHGVWYTRMTDSIGTAKLNINLDAGSYIITAVNPVNNEMKGFNITVLSTINSSDVVKYYRNGTQYFATFYGFNGEALADTNVTFNINGVFYTRTTNSNGTAMLNINLRPIVGDYVLTAYNPVTGEAISNNVTVLPVLTGKDVEMTTSQRSTYDVQVVDGEGNPLAGETVIININGVFYDRITDDNGVAHLNINLDVGTYIATAYWNESITGNKVIVKP